MAKSPSLYMLTLEGIAIPEGWTIRQLVQRNPEQSGGYFSVGYKVDHADGRQGFMKALDFGSAIAAPDTAKELGALIQTFNFERALLELCREYNMDKVVVAINHGEFPYLDAPLQKIFYIIFELADRDSRTQVLANPGLCSTWCVRCLHHIAVGLRQLHRRAVYHQDLKPSNVLIFDKDRQSKLADFGRSYCASLSAPHDGLTLPGAARYAPPEQLYQYSTEDRNASRQAADLYLLGSMLYFFFTKSAVTPDLVGALQDAHKPSRWLGAGQPSQAGWRGYYKDILPFVEQSYMEVVGRLQLALSADPLIGPRPAFAAKIVNIFKYLTAPDPERRGHPSSKRDGTLRYELDRVIAELDLIANWCETWGRACSNAKAARRN